MKANGRRRWRKWARNRWKSSVRAERLPPIMPSWYYRKRRHELNALPNMNPKPFSARSLVGMSMRRRKALCRGELNAARKKDGKNKGRISMFVADAILAKYRIGELLRPCPGKHGCRNCTRTCGACEDQCPDDMRCKRCGSVMTTEGPFCDGAGVLPARNARR